MPVVAQAPAPVVDALGRTVRLAAPARRVVSLVPSETHSVVALAGAGRLVGRTRFCVEPPLPHVPEVGGTKDVDVAHVLALAPDLVLANQEENARPAIEQLLASGVPVHVSFPCDVADAVAYLRALSVLLGVASDHADRLDALRRDLAARPHAGVRAFVPIWEDPLMTFDARAFASDALELAGAVNVFCDRPRRYPLAADLGLAPPLPPERTKDRDTRYPRVTLDEVRARGPELVLLPDEPYAYGEADRARWAALLPRARVELVSGKDLLWYGAWLIEGLPRLAACVTRA